LLRAVAAVYLPNRVLVRQNDAPAMVKPLVEGKDPALAYVCRNFTCEKPIGDAGELKAALTVAARRTSP